MWELWEAAHGMLRLADNSLAGRTFMDLSNQVDRGEHVSDPINSSSSHEGDAPLAVTLPQV